MTQAPPNAALSLENVTKWYGNVVAVNDVSFVLNAGITGLLGPNGAGKSTILHMLAGILKPSSGEAKVSGESAWQNPEIYRRVGFVPERETVYSFLNGLDFVKLSARLHGLDDPDAAAVRAIEAVEMQDAMKRPTGGYSKGMKQRIKIAAAIVHQPSILLLDEPFNGADPRQRLRMMDMLRAHGRRTARPSSSPPTSSRRSSRSPRTSSSSSPAASPLPATSTRSAG